MYFMRAVGGVLGAGALAVGLTACGSSSPSASSGGGNSGAGSSTTATLTLAQWRSQAGPALKAVANDLKALSQASSANNVSAFQSDAQQLANDVKVAQALPDNPVPSLQSLWSQSLTTFSTTASEFLQAIQQQNQSLLQQGAADLQKAGNELQQFDNALQAAANG